MHTARTCSIIMAMILLAACQRASDTFSTATPMRTGENLPEQFEPPASHSRIGPTDTIPGASCVSPLRDPRDGTEVRMVRSSRSLADYAVPQGHYGVTDSELLRLDCNTGKPLGIVQR
jgi:hypothetical protein